MKSSSTAEVSTDSPTKLVQHLYTQRLKTWGEWEQVSVEAEGTSPS